MSWAGVNGNVPGNQGVFHFIESGWAMLNVVPGTLYLCKIPVYLTQVLFITWGNHWITFLAPLEMLCMWNLGNPILPSWPHLLSLCSSQPGLPAWKLQALQQKPCPHSSSRLGSSSCSTLRPTLSESLLLTTLCKMAIHPHHLLVPYHDDFSCRILTSDLILTLCFSFVCSPLEHNLHEDGISFCSLLSSCSWIARPLVGL